MLDVRYSGDVPFNESVIKFKSAIDMDEGSSGGKKRKCRCIVFKRFVMLLPS